MPWTMAMTHPLTARSERRNVRALLIAQQSTDRPDLPLPRMLRTPAIIILWALALSTTVAALALGRVRVPRVERGVVRVERTGADSLTPVLILPSSARRYAEAGQLATVDTGGPAPLTLALASVPATKAGEPRGAWLSIDTATIALPLERCRASQCLLLSRDRRFTATARLGTRSLASFALPRS